TAPSPHRTGKRRCPCSWLSCTCRRKRGIGHIGHGSGPFAVLDRETPEAEGRKAPQGTGTQGPGKSCEWFPSRYESASEGKAQAKGESPGGCFLSRLPMVESIAVYVFHTLGTSGQDHRHHRRHGNPGGGRIDLHRHVVDPAAGGGGDLS